MAKYTITLDKLLDRTDRGNVLQAIGMIRGVEDIDGVPLPEESPSHSIQQLKAEIRAIVIELECTTFEQLNSDMYHNLRSRLRELSAISRHTE